MNDNLAAQLAMLPEALSGHLLITVLPLSLGIAVSVPLALYASRHPRLRLPLLTVVGTIQTVPGLALLALMVPLLIALGGVLRPVGIEVPALGLLPALVALTLYSMLPIVRNTVTGIEEVDPALTEAATAMGMTPLQVLLQVQLPLAAPVILAGIRTAAVWVVGTGTLATPVGQTSLGNYIFAGLQTRNTVAVVFGCVAAAALAIGLDAALALLERGVRERRRALVGWAGALLVSALGVGLLAPVWARSGDDRTVVVVGAKTFTEQYVLAAALELRLEAAGFAVQRMDSLGSTVAFDALVGGKIDAYVDYSGTLWANHMGRTEQASGPDVLAAVMAWLDETHGARLLGPLGFENTYAFALRRADARALGATTLHDLSARAPSLSLGADYEFLQRPEWAAVRDGYQLRFAREVTYDPAFLYQAVASGEVDVISAFSSDGRIAAFDLQTLDDPLGTLPPYDAVILLSPDTPPGVAEALAPLVGAVPIEQMREANRRVDLDGVQPEVAAEELLAAVGLLQTR